jgi:hypothetical protein
MIDLIEQAETAREANELPAVADIATELARASGTAARAAASGVAAA